MNNESKSIIISMIGLLIGLLTALLSLEFSIVIKVISSYYFLLVVIVAGLFYLVWLIKASVGQSKKEIEGEIRKIEDKCSFKMQEYKEKFEEKFKIHDRLNKLEVKVFNG